MATNFKMASITFILSMLALNGCAYRYAVADGKPLMMKQGLVVMKISANADAVLQFSKHEEAESSESEFAKESLHKRTIVVTKGQQYWILPVVSGEYVWRKFSTGKMHSWLRETKRFVVKENEIIYLGHVDIDNYTSNYRISTVDDEDDIVAYLNSNYPIYAKKFPLNKDVIRFKN